MFAAKELQRSHKKTIIFIDHEKVKEEDSGIVNAVSFGKYYPECMNGVSKILIKESDYIFRIAEDIIVREDKKTQETSATFNGLVLHTDRKQTLEAVLKSSLPLPAKIKATYSNFREEYKAAYQKISKSENTPKENVIYDV